MTIDRPQLRTIEQNAMYWATVVTPFAEFLAEHDPTITKEDAHELLKRKFLAAPIIDMLTGEVILENGRIGSTTDLTTAQMSEYINRCARHLRECYHIRIDLPGGTEGTGA